MARPAKKRRVCEEPLCRRFVPQTAWSNEGRVILTVDEYESIRLIDYEGLTQKECAEQMNLVRTSITAIYASARKKVADSIVNGRELCIQGGNYELCNGNLNCCRQRLKSGNRCLGKMKDEWRKRRMVIAVTYENGQVFQHFGHSEYFKIYQVEDGKILKSEVYDTNGQGHGALAGFLHEYSVDVLICGGIGGGARNALAQMGIELFPGVTGAADDAVKALIEGSLSYDPDTMCSHHSGEHNCGEHDHSCGEHGHNCGGHTCG